MLGINSIGAYLPQDRASNYKLKEKFGIDDDFIENKIGVKYRAIKSVGEKASDLCVGAFEDLKQKAQIDLDKIDCVVVVTQNPDFNIPHTSAIIHGKLGLGSNCAAFDVSLGCSGYVYGLSVILSFMKANGLKNGLLFTADPYSEIINPDDKNTSLLFGDGASVTYINEYSNLNIIDFAFGTSGKDYASLIKEGNGLFMNGRAIFNFSATKIPPLILDLLAKNDMGLDDIDMVFLHQGSKYIVDTIAKRLGVEKTKAPFLAGDYGNLISSSIPFMLKDYIDNDEVKKIAIAGFGVGLSYAAALIQKTQKEK